jgi:lysyl-tRNA synthetase class 2
MLEWYRPGWDHHQLMEEVEALLRATLPGVVGEEPAERLTYQEAFRRHAGVDPFAADAEALRQRAAELGVAAADDADWTRDEWLHLLFAAAVEPRLGRARASFVHDFPAAEAALARVRPGDPPLAERFEAFVAGVELANGYHELADPTEQRRRFDADLAARRQRGLPAVVADERLLAALQHGFPDCAGVALGFDRLVMLAVGAGRIDEVIAFPADRS